MTRQAWDIFEKKLKESNGGFVLRRKGLSAVDVHFFPWVKIGFEVDGYDKGVYPNAWRWFERINGMEEVGRGYETVLWGEKM